MRTGLQIACVGITTLILNTACGKTGGETRSPSTASTIEEVPGSPQRATAIIGRTEASFTIPVGRRAVWRWNQPETRPNHREYQWDVSSPDAAFGFSLFKDPVAEPKEGSLNELLAAGQVSVWEGLPNGGGQIMKGSEGILSNPGGRGIHAEATDNESAVSIVISDQTAVARLLATKPAVVEVVARAPNTPDQRYSVAVTYQNR